MREKRFKADLFHDAISRQTLDYRRNPFDLERQPNTLHGRQTRKTVSFMPLTFFQRGCSSVDRVLASEAKGRWFDPSQPRHPPQSPYVVRNLEPEGSQARKVPRGCYT